MPDEPPFEPGDIVEVDVPGHPTQPKDRMRVEAVEHDPDSLAPTGDAYEVTVRRVSDQSAWADRTYSATALTAVDAPVCAACGGTPAGHVNAGDGPRSTCCNAQLYNLDTL